MPFLPNLIKRVDEFFKIAESYSLVSLGADDKALLAELAKAAKESVNPEVSYNLRVLAAMYAKALEINGGFHTVYMALSGMIEDIDPDEEESEPIENILNQIGNSIKSRAQRPDSPGDMRELQMAATAARGDDTPYSYEESEDDGDNVSAYEAGLMGYQERDGEEIGDIFKDEGGVSQFDMTGGVNPEAAQSGFGRGFGVGKRYTYKDWAEVYAEERKKYSDDLNGPAEMLTPSARIARNDPKIQANLQALVDVLGKLSALTLEAISTYNQISLETEVAHPEEDAKLAKIHAELNKLERERRLLKRNLNKFYKNSKVDTLRNQLAQPNLTTQKKRILEEELKLQELRTSGKYGYGKEAKERVRFIDALTADPNLPPDQIKAFEEAIAGAAQFTDRMTKSQYDRTRTLQKGEEEGRKYIPTAPAARGGGRYKKQVDFDTATYPALLKRFRELNNTITSDAKKYVARSGNEKGDDRMKPYVEAVSAAIKKKNSAAKFAAINALKEAIKATLVADASLRGYLWSIRLAPHFKAVEEFLFNIKTKQDANGSWNLNEAERETLRGAATQLTRIMEIFTRYFPQKPTGKNRNYGRSHYLTSVAFYPTLINYIYNNILQEEPPAKEATAMSKAFTRMQLLAMAMSETNTYKLAQDIGTEPGEIDQATADKMAQDIFDQLYKEELQKLLQS